MPTPADRAQGSWIEIAWVVGETSLWFDRRFQAVRAAEEVALEKASLSFEGVFDLLNITALLIRFVMEFKARDAESCCAQPCDETCNPYEINRALYQAYQVLIAGKVLQVFFNWLSFLSNYEEVGILIIMVKRMGTDVATFMSACTPMHPDAPAPPHASVRVAAGRDERTRVRLRGRMAPALRRACTLVRPAPVHASPALVRSPVLRCRAGFHGGGCGAGDGGAVQGKRAVGPLCSHWVLLVAAVVHLWRHRSDGLHVGLRAGHVDLLLHLHHRHGQPAGRHVR